MSEVLSLDVSDRLDIHQLIALYGFLIDERMFSRFDEVFVNDATVDFTDLGGFSAEGLTTIRDKMAASEDHPLAHHSTNIMINAIDQCTANVTSKGIGVGYKGRVGSVTYRDVVLKTPAGWRIARRVCTLRRSQDIPEIS